MSGLNKVYGENCNWWCRRWKDIKDIAEGYINGGLFGAGAALIESIGKIDYSVELPLADILILDKWYATAVEPYIKSSMLKLDVISSATNLIPEEKLKRLNDLVSEFCLIDNYYKLLENQSLTEAGKKEQKRLVDTFLTNLEYVVSEIINNDLDVAFIKQKISVQNFKLISPIVISRQAGFTSYECSQYYFDYSGNNPIDLDPVDSELVDLNPVDVNTPIDTTIITEPVATKKSSGLPFWVWLLGAWGTYKILK